MRSTRITVVFLVAFLNFAGPAKAASGYEGLSLMTPFFMQTRSIDNGGIKTDSTQNLNSYRIGYTFPQGLYFGGVYDLNKETQSSSTLTESRLGLSAGYAMKGWFFVGHYFFDLKKELSSTQELQKGSGIGMDVGYTVPLGSNINLGAQLSFRALEYQEISSGGSTQSADYKESQLYPLIVLGTTF